MPISSISVMVWIFFSLLIGLILLSVLFIVMPFKFSVRSWWLLFSVSSVFIIFVSTWYFFTGKPAHIIYAQEDVSLRQMAQLLENAAPLSQDVQVKIAAELARQESRAGAQPTVGLLKAQLAMQQHDYIKAQQLYARAYALTPDDPNIASSYAQTWYLAENQRVSPALQQFLHELQQRYVTQMGEQTGLINLLAVVAFNEGDYTKAIQYWQQLLSTYSMGSPEALAIQAGITQAEMMQSK